MFWSQPKPCANSIAFSPRPEMRTLLRCDGRHEALDTTCGAFMGGSLSLGARGEPPTAADGRCIPPLGVAHRSNISDVLPLPALIGGRLGRLGASRVFHHGLLDRMGTSCSGSLRRTGANEQSDVRCHRRSEGANERSDVRRARRYGVVRPAGFDLNGEVRRTGAVRLKTVGARPSPRRGDGAPGRIRTCDLWLRRPTL